MKETEFERHLEFVEEGTLAANEEVFIFVQDDPDWGLKVPADSGYVTNDGPGEIKVRNSDDGEHYTKPRTIKNGDQAAWENDDDVWNHTVQLVADSSGASYRACFARSRW